MMTRQMPSTVSSGRSPRWRPAMTRIIAASRPGRKAEPEAAVPLAAISRSMIRPRSIRSSCMAASIRSISARSAGRAAGGEALIPLS